MAFERTVLMLERGWDNSKGAERDKKCRGSRAGSGITDVVDCHRPETRNPYTSPWRLSVACAGSIIWLAQMQRVHLGIHGPIGTAKSVVQAMNDNEEHTTALEYREVII